MKWVLAVLVAANLVYFGWMQLADTGQEPGPTAVNRAPEQHGEGLVLLSEAGVEPVFAAGSATAATAGGEALCWMLGPLAEEVTAKQVQMRFESQDIPAELREIETTTGLDYLLYIGPFGSREEGLGRLRELQAEGVDSFLITRGSLANAISLGLFSGVAQAETALASYTEQGFEAQIRENERTGKQQWLIVPMAKADALDGTFWEELRIDFEGLERQQNWCKSIASADGIE